MEISRNPALKLHNFYADNRITDQPNYRVRYHKALTPIKLDFIVEYVEQIEKEKNHFGQIVVDTVREIGINKICTLISRCEQKDIIDLYFLSRNGFDIAANFTAAQQKDAGLDPAMVSHLLSEIHIESIPEYMLQEISIEQLETFSDTVRYMVAELAFPRA